MYVFLKDDVFLIISARGAENRRECLHISEILNKLAICTFPHFS